MINVEILINDKKIKDIEVSCNDLLSTIQKFINYRSVQKINSVVRVLQDNSIILFSIDKTGRYTKKGKLIIDENSITKILNENNIKWEYGSIKL